MSTSERNAWAEKLRKCHAVVAKARGAACKVFLALQSFADGEGYCWPLISTIQDYTNIRRDITIFDALRDLESLGVLSRRTLISRKEGRNSPTLYRIGGGKVEKLPENACKYYVLGLERPRKSPVKAWSKRGCGSGKCSVAIEVLPGNPSTGTDADVRGGPKPQSPVPTPVNGGDSAKSDRSPVTANTDATVTPNSAVHNYSIELPHFDEGKAITDISSNRRSRLNPRPAFRQLVSQIKSKETNFLVLILLEVDFTGGKQKAKSRILVFQT
jgi:hypothetical protein